MPRRRSNYDFCGWATRNDVKCSDGRTIKRDAFKDDDGIIVPLVWNHDHGDPSNVLGHAELQNRAEGVYAYCKLNDTDSGKTARELIKHGDVTRLSIYANKLKQNGGDVIHGSIKEVSLVLAGANQEAKIEDVFFHSDTGELESAFIETTEDGSLCHSEEEMLEEVRKLKKKAKDSEDDEEDEEDEDSEEESEGTEEKVEKKKEVKKEEKEIEHSDEKGENDMAAEEKTVEQIYNEMSDEQKDAVQAIIGAALGSQEDGGDEEDMKHNVFDSDEKDEGLFLSHADEEAIFADAKRFGSLKDSVLAHTDNYGIQELPSDYSDTTYGIEALFPDYKELNTPPEWIKRETEWVAGVMAAVHHTPFSRIKTTYADITEDEARALGYMKGNLKKEEVFTLLKRTTDPQTIYKKQKLDRDDIIDITSFDVVAWIKGEMRMMLHEEIARAILIGDGRSSASADKIKEDHVRPIWTDAELFSIHDVKDTKGMTPPQKAKDFIKRCIKARKDYKGSGNPVMYTTEDWLTEMLLLEDNIGRALFDSESALATKLRVSKIVTVPVMEGATRTVDGVERTLDAIIVNLRDYNVGADKGGAVNMFEDFDIDYNQEKYLIETRISGALIKPKSAIVLESYESTEDGGNDDEDDGNGEG
jgi:HK97 family phage prohead protease/HK97 family phage major capsid protein